MAEIRVMLVDDHEVVRQGLASLLARREHLRVVAEAGSVAEAVAEAGRVQPDVIVMDVRLPDGTGIEACREIRAAHPNIRVLMLTSYADDEAVYAAIVAGAPAHGTLAGPAHPVPSGQSRMATGLRQDVLGGTGTAWHGERRPAEPERGDRQAASDPVEQTP